MKPSVIIVPLFILFGGVAAFFLVPLELPLRAAILGSDVLAAAFVGFMLWRRNQG